MQPIKKSFSACLFGAVFALTFTATSGSGSEKQEHAPEDSGSAGAPDMVERAARTSGRDIKIPKALVARIEREYKASLEKIEGAKKEHIKRALINITAELTQNHPGPLHENVRVNTPTGGGVIDLSELVTPVRGVIRVKLAARRGNDGHPMTTSRIFFVSHAKRRILAGEEYGAGCDKFMEITTQFHKKWETTGFDVYTADQRYVSVLGGTFIFVEFDKEALGVGAVSFTDSRFPELLCE